MKKLGVLQFSSVQFYVEVLSEFDTFGVEEAGFPAVVHHLLLALLRSRHDSSELLRRGAVVELPDVRFEQRGALNRDGGWAVMHQKSPHLFLCKEKLLACQHRGAADAYTHRSTPNTHKDEPVKYSNIA